MAMKKEPLFAESPCPVCDGKAKAAGLTWRCMKCGRSYARAYKSDPDGYDFHGRDDWFARVRYRMEHGLPFEKGHQYLPEQIFYHFEQSWNHRLGVQEPTMILRACTKTVTPCCTARSYFWGGSAFKTKEECLAQFREYLRVQEELSASSVLIEDSDWRCTI